LTISTSNNIGIVSGTPATSGNISVSITVTDSAVPSNSKTKNFSLVIIPVTPVPVYITTTELTRWPVEKFPANPPASWGPLPPPGWIINQAYTANMTATGGVGALSWTATNLPAGLTISTAGVISGNATVNGLFNITFMVGDTANPPNTASVTLPLKIYVVGDADGNGTMLANDVTYLKLAILGLKAPTAGCDSKLDGNMSIADVTKLERLLMGLTRIN